MSHDAFISYSRSADRDLAPALRTGLQQLGKAWNRRHALDVFLDKTSLEASSSLQDALYTDLDASRYLVLLASPASARSRWVTAELRRWIDIKGSAEQILVALSDGEIVWDTEANDFDWDRTTGLDPQLSGAFSEEPLYVDFRFTEGADPTLLDVRHNSEFEDAVAALAAPIHGLSKEDLVGLDLVQFRRARRLRRGAAGLLTLLTVVALTLAFFADQQRRSAQENEVRAQRQAGLALSRSLALAAREAIDDDLTRAQLLAIEATRVRLGDSSATVTTQEATFSLLDVVATDPAVVETTAHVEDAVALGVSGDGTVLMVVDSGGRTFRIDRANDTMTEGGSVPGAVVGVRPSNDVATAYVVAIADGDTQYWQVRFDLPSASYLGSLPDAHNLRFSANRPVIAYLSGDEYVVQNLEDGTDATPIPVDLSFDLSTAALDADGSRVAVGSGRTIEIWEIADEVSRLAVVELPQAVAIEFALDGPGSPPGPIPTYDIIEGLELNQDGTEVRALFGFDVTEFRGRRWFGAASIDQPDVVLVRGLDTRATQILPGSSPTHGALILFDNEGRELEINTLGRLDTGTEVTRETLADLNSFPLVTSVQCGRGFVTSCGGNLAVPDGGGPSEVVFLLSAGGAVHVLDLARVETPFVKIEEEDVAGVADRDEAADQARVGDILASIESARTVRFEDALSGEREGSFTIPGESITDIAGVGRTSIVAVLDGGSSDSGSAPVLHLVDARTASPVAGEIPLPFSAAGRPLLEVTGSTLGVHASSGISPASFEIDLSLEALVVRACKRAGRNLTPAEQLAFVGSALSQPTCPDYPFELPAT